RLATEKGRARYRRPDAEKSTTRKAANRGLTLPVSGNLVIGRLRGGCDRDRTCDPYHVKVVVCSDCQPAPDISCIIPVKSSAWSYSKIPAALSLNISPSRM